MHIQILTPLPGICESVLRESILGRAQEAGLVSLEAVDLRRWTTDKHRSVDAPPYGGGPGMVMKIEPIAAALQELRKPENLFSQSTQDCEAISEPSASCSSSALTTLKTGSKSKVIFMSPQGKPFDQVTARRLAREEHLIFLCGHYEGVDQRVIDHLIDEEISIGDYVLTNGALAALVVTDAIVRLIPGVLGHEDSAALDSFEAGILDHPHYTRPEKFNGWNVPPILLSGHHGAIATWREEQAQEMTRKKRPDLI
ncbi:MAG: tRNA (guanosine(37)-N1)-methyltransferase TrmD [Chthoniobacterales bacterium]